MTTPLFIPIIVDDHCIGHVIQRLRQCPAFEAFDRADRSLGLFPTAATAVDALVAVITPKPAEGAP
jgi:hypothetical protein